VAVGGDIIDRVGNAGHFLSHGSDCDTVTSTDCGRIAAFRRQIDRYRVAGAHRDVHRAVTIFGQAISPESAATMDASSDISPFHVGNGQRAA
jgi:hypothetical protein